MNIHIYVILSAVLGFCLSTYVYKQTNRESLEQKAMIILDFLFVSAFVFGVVSYVFELEMVLPEWLILAILIPLNSYVGVVAVHYRNEKIEQIARQYRLKEEEKCRKPLEVQ